MEQEIDLRPYFQALMRRWRLILGLVIGVAAFAIALTLLSPRAVLARGDLLVISKSSQVTLDPRFVDRDATMLTNSVNQRQALVDLASSAVLEARVADELGMSDYVSGELLDRVDVTASSDLLRITASGNSSEEALRLAEVWTRTYEALVNELYSGTDTTAGQLQDQLEGAQQRFEEIQSELNSFYSSGDLVRADQQVQRLQGLLEGGIEAQLNLYSNYLTRTQELSLILEDARNIQAQYSADDSNDLGASLAALTVRARIAGGEQLPVQLSFSSAESFAQTQAAASDLERFVLVLEGERDRMVAQADALARDLAAGNASTVGLPSDVRARYEQDLAVAEGALALAQGQENLLIQRRRVALTSLEVLQAKADEGQISEGVPEVSVRYVGIANVPPRSLLSGLIINVVAAVFVGLFVGIAWIVGRELMRRMSIASGTPLSTQPERSVEQGVASD